MSPPPVAMEGLRRAIRRQDVLWRRYLGRLQPWRADGPRSTDERGGSGGGLPCSP